MAFNFQEYIKNSISFFKSFGSETWIILTFFGLIFFSFLEPDLSNFTIIPVDRPDFQFESVTFSHIQEGELTWSFTADAATIDKVDQIASLLSVMGDFFKDGEKILSLESPRGVLNMETSRINLDVAEIFYVVNDKPVTLNARLLSWDPDVQKFEGKGDVSVMSGSVDIKGEYFFVDLEKQHIEMSKNSRASIKELP